jgi:hypothetical protein
VSVSPSSTSRWRSRLARAALLALALAAVAALGLLASACGGSSSEGVAQVDTTTTTTDGSASSPDSSSADPATYSACMRSHGVPKFPDPDSDGRLRLRAGPGTGIDPQSAQFEAAAEACRELAPPEEAPSPAQQAEEREQFLEFSACMRENGLPEFPDPDSSGITLGRNSGLDPDSPQFKRAEQACEDLLPGGGKDRSTSSSGGTP